MHPCTSLRRCVPCLLHPCTLDAQGYTGKDGNKLENSGGGNPLAAPVVAAALALPFVFVVSLFVVAPGNQLPFNFLDGLYRPRVAEMAQIKAINEENVLKEKAAKDKAAAEKAAAAAEAAAKTAAAAPAAKK